MILHGPRIIVGDAGFKPGTSSPEVWRATNEPPHLYGNFTLVHHYQDLRKQLASKKLNIYYGRRGELSPQDETPGGQLTGGQLTVGQPPGGRLIGGKLTGGQPTGGQPSGGHSHEDQPTGGHPREDQPTGGHPSGGHLSGRQSPGGQSPGAAIQDSSVQTGNNPSAYPPIIGSENRKVGTLVDFLQHT